MRVILKRLLPLLICAAALLGASSAWASFTVVGEAENSVLITAMVSSLQTSATLNVAQHDRLQIIVYAETATTPTVSDTGGDTFTTLVTSFQPQTGYHLYVYEVVDAAANSADSITANASAAQLIAVAVLQIRGLTNSGAATFNTNSQTNVSGTDAISGGAATPAAQPAAVIGFDCIVGTNSPAKNMASTAGTGFTAQTGVWTSLGGGAGDYMGAFETEEVTSTSSVAATWTQTSNNQFDVKGSMTLVIPETGSASPARAPTFSLLGVG